DILSSGTRLRRRAGANQPRDGMAVGAQRIHQRAAHHPRRARDKNFHATPLTVEISVATSSLHRHAHELRLRYRVTVRASSLRGDEKLGIFCPSKCGLVFTYETTHRDVLLCVAPGDFHRSSTRIFANQGGPNDTSCCDDARWP